MSRGFPRRLVLLGVVIFVAVASLTYLSSQPRRLNAPYTPPTPHHAGISLDKSSHTGSAIAPKMGNATAKAELGRAAWKVLHTTMARFPDAPTAEESETLRSYIHLFQRLYPCGECAEHFGELLRKFPPQVSSRSAAAVWACHVHNEVNKSLGKELFDCAQIGDFYDCGCADDVRAELTGDVVVAAQAKKPRMDEDTKEKIKTNGRDLDLDLFGDSHRVLLEKTGLA